MALSADELMEIERTLAEADAGASPFAALRARFPHLAIVRFAHPREAERWLSRLQVDRAPRRYSDASGASTAPPNRRSRDR